MPLIQTIAIFVPSFWPGEKTGFNAVLMAKRILSSHLPAPAWGVIFTHLRIPIHTQFPSPNPGNAGAVVSFFENWVDFVLGLCKIAFTL